jgi:thioredoxin reductase (NADPH)
MVKMASERTYDVIIIGAGPAGLTTAIYTSRAGLKTLVVDESMAGGQVKTTHKVANYPGFIESISGLQLAQNMKEQAMKFGTEFELATDIEDFCLKETDKWLLLDSGDKVTSKFIVLGTGTSPRRLGLPGEAEYKGNGISYCATCDGEFYKDKDVIVVGGGNSAMEESLLLLRYVKSLTIIHQFDKFQAEKITVDKVLANPKVNVILSHEPREFSQVEQNDSIVKMEVKIENMKDYSFKTLTADGVFIFVGMIPNGKFLQTHEKLGLEMNKWGYILTDERMRTNISGIYAVGDIREKPYRQITTAVGDGTVASLEVIKQI